MGIRARHLRVSSEQTLELFRVADVDLSPEDVRRIAESTEGWLAGIHLALLRIRDEADPDAFVASFAGDTRQVLAYLQQDVLASADPEIRNFLVRTSVLERLSAPLCDAVLETSGSAAMLDEISRLNLFLARLGETGSEYRYHQLFAAMLRQELEATDAAAAPRLHARASRWHEEQGDIEQAVTHAIESKDVDRASMLVTRASVPLLSIGRGGTVTRWLEALSWPGAEADQQLGIVRALTAGMTGRGRDEIERWLEVAAAGPEIGPLANGISSLRSGVAMIRSLFLTRGIAEAERAAMFVLEHEPDGSPWRYAGLVPLGQALFLQGRSDEARAPLAEARALPGARRLASTSVGMAYLALIELEAGDRRVVGAARSRRPRHRNRKRPPIGRRRREPASRAWTSPDAGSRPSCGGRTSRACGRADCASRLAVLARPRAASRCCRSPPAGRPRGCKHVARARRHRDGRPSGRRDARRSPECSSRRARITTSAGGFSRRGPQRSGAQGTSRVRLGRLTRRVAASSICHPTP